MLLQNKDQRAFTYLYAHYFNTLYRIIIHITGYHNSTDEILQDVFLKIWNKIDYFDSSKGKLYTWMVTITKNTTKDYLKSKDFKNQIKNEDLPDFTGGEEKLLTFLSIDHIGIQNIISVLKPDLKEIIELFYYKGYTHKEISEELNLPLGTVKTLIRRALLILKNSLPEYN